MSLSMRPALAVATRGPSRRPVTSVRAGLADDVGKGEKGTKRNWRGVTWTLLLMNSLDLHTGAGPKQRDTQHVSENVNTVGGAGGTGSGKGSISETLADVAVLRERQRACTA